MKQSRVISFLEEKRKAAQKMRTLYFFALCQEYACGARLLFSMFARQTIHDKIHIREIFFGKIIRVRRVDV